MPSITEQLFWLFVLAIPIACVAWTVTHEEVFKEPRLYCTRKSIDGSRLVTRKFFYMLTCEYCFSHYVTILFIVLTDFHLLRSDWVGYIIAGFALVWVANVYMSLYGFLRIDLKKERIITTIQERRQKEHRGTSSRMEKRERV